MGKNKKPGEGPDKTAKPGKQEGLLSRENPVKDASRGSSPDLRKGFIK
ncbi:MAG: hypothetical protein K0R65_2776 [Crocinitomicaceae bacterium]|jgi:hypothetical protein|nr:hypothetical protein [Crocinitomicaceae bacterium]